MITVAILFTACAVLSAVLLKMVRVYSRPICGLAAVSLEDSGIDECRMTGLSFYLYLSVVMNVSFLQKLKLASTGYWYHIVLQGPMFPILKFHSRICPSKAYTNCFRIIRETEKVLVATVIKISLVMLEFLRKSNVVGKLKQFHEQTPNRH